MINYNEPCIGCKYNAEAYWEDWKGDNELHFHRRHGVRGLRLPKLEACIVSIACNTALKFPERNDFKLERVEYALDKSDLNKRRYGM